MAEEEHGHKLIQEAPIELWFPLWLSLLEQINIASRICHEALTQFQISVVTVLYGQKKVVRN